MQPEPLPKIDGGRQRHHRPRAALRRRLRARPLTPRDGTLPILLNWRSGSVEHVGKAAIFDIDGDWTYASFILRVRVNEGQNNQYLWRLLNFMRKRQLFGAATSQQINFKMNAAYFRDVLVPVSDESIQDEIVAELQCVWVQINQLDVRIQEVRNLQKMIIAEMGIG